MDGRQSRFNRTLLIILAVLYVLSIAAFSYANWAADPGFMQWWMMLLNLLILSIPLVLLYGSIYVLVIAWREHTALGQVSPRLAKIIHWAPRAAAILIIFFVGLFSLDVFEMEGTPLELLATSSSSATYLTAPKPATFQFMLHALSPFDVDEQASRLLAKQPKASVTAQYLSPTPLNFRQWAGFEPKPDREFPNRHVEAGTREKLAELRMLTVIVPQRTGQPDVAWKAERLESDTAIGVRIVRDSKATLVAFRKADQGKARLEGLSFDQAASVATR